MGFSFSLIAFFDGFGMDDRYPGYGKLVRRYSSMREEYIDEKEALMDTLNYIKDQVIDEIYDIITDTIIMNT